MIVKTGIENIIVFYNQINKRLFIVIESYLLRKAKVFKFTYLQLPYNLQRGQRTLGNGKKEPKL